MRKLSIKISQRIRNTNEKLFQAPSLKTGVFHSANDVLALSWTLKLTESWGESINDSKGEVDGSKSNITETESCTSAFHF